METKKRSERIEKEENVESDEYGMDEILCEEERKKKLVYIFTIAEGSAYDIKLTTFNPHEATSGFIDKTPDNLPPDLLIIRYYDIAALESKLYFIGGYHLYEQTMSNKVFAFNTLSGEWSTLTPMGLKRVFSTVLTHGNKIYVFGFARHYLDSNTLPLPTQWAEFYDPVTDRWNYLPGTAPERLNRGDLPLVHALIEERGIVIFCVEQIDFYGYSFRGKNWFRVDYPGHCWSNTVAVVQSNLFWPWNWTIRGYRFQPYEINKTDTMCTLPNDDLPSLSFILNAGHGKLCLFFRSGKNIVCYRFELRQSRSQNQFTLHYGGSETYETNDRLFTVLAM